jgi:hypothetical protein
MLIRLQALLKVQWPQAFHQHQAYFPTIAVDFIFSANFGAIILEDESGIPPAPNPTIIL